ELAHKLGATALEERAQTELAATGARPRRLMLSGLESLTPSERRVAELAAENLTNKDIAQALFVTPKTVEVHLSSVYRKLEISSRAQLPDAPGARASHGLRPLRLDTTLARAAQAHTLDMLRGNYFSHGDFSARMAAFHLRGTLGENLAWGSGAYGRAQAIVHLWLASPGHRANLL